MGAARGNPSWRSDSRGTERTTFEVFIKQLRCNWNLTVDDGAYLFVLLFLFQSPFFLWAKLGLFLLFPFAFIFTSLVAHIGFSMIENEKFLSAASDRLDVFGSWPFRSLSFGVGDSLSYLQFFVAHPFKVRRVKEHVIVAPGVDKPEAPVRKSFDGAFWHASNSSKKMSCSVARKHRVQAAPLQSRDSIAWIGHNQPALRRWHAPESESGAQAACRFGTRACNALIPGGSVPVPGGARSRVAKRASFAESGASRNLDETSSDPLSKQFFDALLWVAVA